MSDNIDEINVAPEENNQGTVRKKNLYVPDAELLGLNLTDDTETEIETVADSTVTDDTASEETAAVNTPKEKQRLSFKQKFKHFLSLFIPSKKYDRKQNIIRITALVMVIVFLSSAGYLSYYFIDLYNQNEVISIVRKAFNRNRDDYTYNEDGQFSKFDELKQQNSDIVGWISIEGTEVDNPVFQRSGDNDYYISHDMNGNSESYGALFLDYRCSIDPKSLSQNGIIYGHNMRYGAMFGTLDEYRNISYYEEHPLISFDSLYEKCEYKIFALMITNSGEDNVFGYTFTPYRSNFENADTFMLWTAQCKARSIYNTHIDIRPGDQVLTLSTCCYDFEGARFVIVARRVRNGESSEVDTSKATVNDKVLYSKKYYDKKKMAVPKVEPPTSKSYDNY